MAASIKEIQFDVEGSVSIVQTTGGDMSVLMLNQEYQALFFPDENFIAKGYYFNLLFPSEIRSSQNLGLITNIENCGVNTFKVTTDTAQYLVSIS